MLNKIKYVLLQVRKADDPMRRHEVECFARALRCDAKQIAVYDLLSGVPGRQELDQVDIVLIGGSGDYSVAEGGTWLPRALEEFAATCVDTSKVAALLPRFVEHVAPSLSRGRAISSRTP